MYVEVEVTEEVYTYIKRSYWREDMQDRRYQARKLLFDDVLDYSVAEIRHSLYWKRTLRHRKDWGHTSVSREHL